MTQQMTSEQATNEALLRFTRKLRRTESDAFKRVWALLPDGAKEALGLAEAAADRVRDQHIPTPEGLIGLDWPAKPDATEE